MKAEDLAAIRQGAELQSMKPYFDAEIANLQRAVVSSVLSAVNRGELTPEMALSKWMEYIAYAKLDQKLGQKIRVGQSIGQNNGQTLDIQKVIV
jgi:hypothetical protein